MSHNKKDFLEALERSLGVVTTASKACNISRRTHYRWLEEDEEYAKSVKEIKDIALDFAESQLHKQIGEGNTTATIFFLKTQAKDRGYIEKQQIEVNEPKPFKWFDDE
ncbi:MAG: hypothetical protein CMC15_14400 [Flavobacteriaceae bacterium]|jgi:hypothetical protein|nr:hypothetical protein [Flavobacteriaceae bacterium]|tara:strand:- start:1083 stop:1406 length:324 start_codon:yes stop_codon:yes gene_type:complete